MVDYTKFEIKPYERYCDFNTLKRMIALYLEELTEENKPIEVIKCGWCRRIYYSRREFDQKDSCHYYHNKQYNFDTKRVIPRKPQEIKTPNFCGLARFIGVPKKELSNMFETNNYTKRLRQFFDTICEGDIDANLENPTTSNTKGILYSAVNKHGYTEEGANDLMSVKIVDNITNNKQ